MNHCRPALLALLLFVAFSLSGFAQRELGVRPTETGGPLLAEQAVFDVLGYDVSLRIDPKNKWITGTTVMTAKMVKPASEIILHLDNAMKIDRIFGESSERDRQGGLRYEHKDGKIRITFPAAKRAGEAFETIITYSGRPVVAPRPPWVGGFMWEKTPSGADWVSVALQNDGADLYIPIKDHPSDKADQVAMRITVPDPLVVAGPGKLQETKKNDDGTSTYYWLMTNPIPNYSIVFNAAPYRVIKDSMPSVA
ncbi:MAG TPA: hypothetical protein PKE66_13225, partial [Pyrinomonadaceae bacterium]|nr:hypothetical protein [Pyrinomonadaceae bacterium]